MRFPFPPCVSGKKLSSSVGAGALACPNGQPGAAVPTKKCLHFTQKMTDGHWPPAPKVVREKHPAMIFLILGRSRKHEGLVLENGGIISNTVALPDYPTL